MRVLTQRASGRRVRRLSVLITTTRWLGKKLANLRAKRKQEQEIANQQRLQELRTLLQSSKPLSQLARGPCSPRQNSTPFPRSHAACGCNGRNQGWRPHGAETRIAHGERCPQFFAATNQQRVWASVQGKAYVRRCGRSPHDIRCCSWRVAIGGRPTWT